MLPGEFGKAAIVPLVVSTAEAGRTVAVDGTPGECVGSSVVRCFSKPGIAATKPEVLTARGQARNESARNTRRPVQTAKHSGVLLRAGNDQTKRGSRFDSLAYTRDGVEEAPGGSRRPFGSAHDAALRQIAATKGSWKECVEGEVRGDAIAEAGARGELSPLGAVAADDARIEA